MQTPEKPNQILKAETEKNNEAKKTDMNELFRSFIDEYNKNNQKNYDAGKVSAWLDLANRYSEIKPADKQPMKAAETMDTGNINEILKQTEKNDRANIAAWLEFAEKHKNDINGQKS